MRRNPLPLRRRKPHGWTLLAVVVSVMIVAALAAVAVPVVRGAETVNDAERTAVMFRSLDSSMFSTNGSVLLKGVCVQLSSCPFFLHNLDTTIIAANPATPMCNGLSNFKAGDVTTWRGGAPYSGYPIITGRGLRTPLGWIHDTVIRTAKDNIELHLDSLTLDQANYLDIAIDGTAGATVGTLKYAEQPAIFTATGQHGYLARYQRSGAKTCP